MKVIREATFKIIDRKTGGCVNHIETADNERDTDAVHVRNEKRQQQAIKFQQRWLQTYFLGETLDIVKCQ